MSKAYRFNSSIPVNPDYRMKRAAIRRVSAKARAVRKEWGDACDDRRTTVGTTCEFPGCDQPSEHGHHVKPRGRGGEHSAGNCRLLCRGHHRWVHEHPIEAAVMGLMDSSKIGGAS